MTITPEGGDPEELPLKVTERGPQPLRRTQSAHEAKDLQAALDANHWNRETTALALGISRTTLWRRMRALGITR